MDKLIGTIVVVGLVLVIFLGVFQTGIGGDISEKGSDVNNSFNAVETEPITRD